MLRVATVLAASLLLLPSQRVQAETSHCTAIDSLPATITTQGIYCLKKDLATSITSGAAIEIEANNVTLDCNHWKVGGLGGGPGTTAHGIRAGGRKNITIRNCGVRGFRIGISLHGGDSAYQLVENNRIDLATYAGIRVEGYPYSVRGNRVYDVSGTGSAIGIWTVGEGEVLDNSVVGTNSTGDYAAGIYAESYDAVVFISRNRVSGLSASGSIRGIAGPYRSVITDNAVAIQPSTTVASHVGILCDHGYGSVARDNVVVGFDSPAVGVAAECIASGNFPP